MPQHVCNEGHLAHSAADRADTPGCPTCAALSGTIICPSCDARIAPDLVKELRDEIGDLRQAIRYHCQDCGGDCFDEFSHPQCPLATFNPRFEAMPS